LLAVDAVKRHRERQDGEHTAAVDTWKDRGLVFPTTLGGFVDCTNLMLRSFKPLLKRTGLPNIRFHDLRHTCATLLLFKGVNSKVVADVLGHASVTTTIRKYKTTSAAVSRSANRQRHTTARVGQRLRGGVGATPVFPLLKTVEYLTVSLLA